MSFGDGKLRERVDELEAENAALADDYKAQLEKCSELERELRNSEQIRGAMANVSSTNLNIIGSLQALARELYTDYSDECPDRAEGQYGARMAALGLQEGDA